MIASKSELGRMRIFIYVFNLIALNGFKSKFTHTHTE